MKQRKTGGAEKRAGLDRAVAERLRRGLGVSTAERVRQAGGRALDIAGGVQRIAQAPLDRLFARKALTRRQFEAGERFRDDAFAAGMVARLGQPWDGFGGAGRRRAARPGAAEFMATGRAAAYRRWSAARTALGRLLPMVEEVAWHAGPGDRLIDLGARLLGMTPSRNAEVAALALLRVGLDALADHYGM